MDVRNCKRCNRIFTYTGKNICNYCIEEEQADFDKVREYLFNNRRSTASQVSEATDVDLKVITRFLREGRLESDLVVNDDDGELNCEKCNRQIKSGRFCENCIDELQNGLKKASLEISNNLALKNEMKMRVHTFDVVKKK